MGSDTVFYHASDTTIERHSGEVLPEVKYLGFIRSRYRLLRSHELIQWIQPTALWECRAIGTIVVRGEKAFAAQVELVNKLRWDEILFRHFACDCVDHAIGFLSLLPEEKTPAQKVIGYVRTIAKEIPNTNELTDAGAKWKTESDAIVGKAVDRVESARKALFDIENRCFEMASQSQAYGAAARGAVNDEDYYRLEGRRQATAAHAVRNSRDLERQRGTVEIASAHLHDIRTLSALVSSAIDPDPYSAANACATAVMEISRRDKRAPSEWLINRLLGYAYGKVVL